MKCVMTILVLVLVGFGPFFLHTNVSEANDACFTVIDSQWGKGCKDDDPDSLQLKVQNVCDKTMSLLFCMEREGGKPFCFVTENIKAQGTYTMSACNATGNYKLIGCERAYDCKQELKRITGQ